MLSLQVERRNRVYGKTKITKKEALDKFQAAREKKRKCLAQLEKSMKETYKERTGKEAEKFFAL